MLTHNFHLLITTELRKKEKTWGGPKTTNAQTQTHSGRHTSMYTTQTYSHTQTQKDMHTVEFTRSHSHITQQPQIHEIPIPIKFKHLPS